jgi:serine protease AprX
MEIRNSAPRLFAARRWSGALRGVVACCVLAVSADAFAAAGRKARLSADLADHLSAGSQSIRVIVHGTRDEVDALAARYNVVVGRYLSSGAVLLVNAGQLAALRDDGGVDHLSGDIRIRSSVDAATVEGLGADQAWAGSDEVPGVTGRGVTVAVIDSGIDTAHKAFGTRVIFSKDFTGHNDATDHYGHGTHVAAIIAGEGSIDSGYRGIAPGASLLNLRVLGDDGSGDESDVIEAIDWTVEHRREFNVRVINLSLGAPVLQPYRDDPLCEAVERAVRAGIAVVAAAGNYGRTADGKTIFGGITSPANSPFAIAVGAIDTHATADRSDDTVAAYSSKGPTRYDLIVKPDLAAPGSHIVSAEAASSLLATKYADHHISGRGTTAAMQLSGTSMAAGVISGAVALLVDEHERLKPAEAKAILQVTSTFMRSVGLVGAGAGSVNVVAAANFTSTALSRHLSHGYDSHSASGLVLAYTLNPVHSQDAGRPSIIWGSNGDSIIWGSVQVAKTKGESILWGSSGDSIIWGCVGDSIIWGSNGDSIIWGSNGDSIIWGSNGDSIIWGSNGDSIIWGSNGDSIIWGSSTSAIDVDAA